MPCLERRQDRDRASAAEAQSITAGMPGAEQDGEFNHQNA